MVCAQPGRGVRHGCVSSGKAHKRPRAPCSHLGRSLAHASVLGLREGYVLHSVGLGVLGSAGLFIGGVQASPLGSSRGLQEKKQTGQDERWACQVRLHITIVSSKRSESAQTKRMAAGRRLARWVEAGAKLVL